MSNKNKKIFDDAIAEARTVREMAITNAKLALEESFTPHLKSMLVSKIEEMEKEEVAEEQETVVKEEESVEETEEVAEEANLEEEDINLESLLAELDAEDNVKESEEQLQENEEVDEAKKSEKSEDEKTDSKKSEKSEKSEDKDEEDEDIDLTDMSEEDLTKLIKDTITAMRDSGELEGGNGEEMEVEKDEEEEISIDEILANLGESEVKEEKVEENNAELEEALATIETLQKELNEINLLNSKLLYANKIFKEKSLSETAKVKVLSSFDKAKTVQESKIVYKTLMDGLNEKKTVSPIKEHRSIASTVIKGANKTENEPIIDDASFKRMQKLAGL